MNQPDPGQVLQAKYRDYCSARITDALLSLSPDEIFSLAEAEARTTGRREPGSYLEAVRLATGRVRDRLGLPEFEDWATEYARNPQAFDHELMGLWKSEETGRGVGAARSRDD